MTFVLLEQVSYLQTNELVLAASTAQSLVNRWKQVMFNNCCLLYYRNNPWMPERFRVLKMLRTMQKTQPHHCYILHWKHLVNLDTVYNFNMIWVWIFNILEVEKLVNRVEANGSSLLNFQYRRMELILFFLTVLSSLASLGSGKRKLYVCYHLFWGM